VSPQQERSRTQRESGEESGARIARLTTRWPPAKAYASSHDPVPGSRS
jgi:hypothetical protein